MSDSNRWWFWSNGMSDGMRGPFLSPLGWRVLLVIAAFAFLFAIVIGVLR